MPRMKDLAGALANAWKLSISISYIELLPLRRYLSLLANYIAVSPSGVFTIHSKISCKFLNLWIAY